MNFARNMSNANSSSIRVDFPQSYNLAMFSSKIPFIQAITVTNILEENLQNISVTVSAVCEEEVLIPPTSFTYPCQNIYGNNFSGTFSYNRKDFYASFSFNKFNYSAFEEVLKKIKNPCQAKVTVEVRRESAVFSSVFSVDLYPYNVWHGLNFNPCITAAYVLPDTLAVEKTVGTLQRINISQTDPTLVLKELYKSIKNKSFVYQRPQDNFTSMKTSLCLADCFFKKQVQIYTPMELSLFFASCAEKIGLCPVVCFFKTESGVSQCYVGIRMVKEAVLPYICEERDRVFEEISKGAVVLFDPSSFSAGHETDFEAAKRACALHLLSDNLTLLCCIDISQSRMNNIVPMPVGEADGTPGKFSNKKSTAVSASKALSNYEQSLYNCRDVRVLRSFFDVSENKLPLFMPDFDKFIESKKDKSVLLSCPEGVNVAAVASFGNHFCSIYAHNGGSEEITKFLGGSVSHNLAEEKELEETVSSLRKRLYSENTLYSPLQYKDFISHIGSLYTFDRGKNVCLFAGFAKLKISQKTYFYPMLIYKARLEYSTDGAVLKYSPEPAIFNYPALREISEKTGFRSFFAYFEKAGHDIKKYIAAFEKLESDLLYKEGFSFEIIKEGYICNFDPSVYYKWLDCNSCREEYLKSEKSAGLLGNSKYTPAAKPEPDKEKADIKKSFVSCLPPHLRGIADICENSAVVSESNSEKELLLSNMLAKNTATGKNSLVYLDTESADCVYESLSSHDLEECTLGLYGEKLNIADFKQKLEKLKEYAEKPVELSEEETYSSNNINAIYDYEYAIHKKYPFGLSFYECVSLYRKNKKKAAVSGERVCFENTYPDFSSLDNEGLAELFGCADNLYNSAAAANSAAGRLKGLSLEGHPLYCINPDSYMKPGDEIKNLFCELTQSGAFVKPKTGAAAKSLGLSENMFKNISQFSHFAQIYHAAAMRPEKITAVVSSPETEVKQLTEKKYAVLRIKTIKEILAFLRPEAFETGLPKSVRDLSDTQGKGFMERKNMKKEAYEALSGFIYPDKKADFMKMPLGDIYALCDEYMEKKEILRGVAETDYELICDSAEVYEEIFRHSVKLGLDTQTIENLFTCVYNFNYDDDEAKILAMELVNLSTGIEKLCRVVGFCPEKFDFSDGVFGKRDICEIIKNAYLALDGYEKWCEWCVAKKAADSFGLGVFAKFIEANGITVHTQSCFYECIYKALCEYIIRDAGKEALSFSSDGNVKYGFSGKCKGFIHKRKLTAAESENIENLISYAENAENLEDFLANFRTEIISLFPIIVADCTGLAYLGTVCDSFDCACVYDAQNHVFPDGVGAIANGKEFVIFGKASKDGNSLINNISGISKRYIDRIGQDTRGEIYSLKRSLTGQSEKVSVVPSLKREESISLLVSDGRFDRLYTRTNSAEMRVLAELLRKRFAPLTDKFSDKKPEGINITALTRGQVNAFLLYIYTRQDGELEIKKAAEAGLINVVPLDEPRKFKYPETVLMTVFAKDSDGMYPTQTFDEQNNFSRIVCGLIDNTKTRLTVITSLDRDVSKTVYGDSGFLALSHLMESCEKKVVYYYSNSPDTVSEQSGALQRTNPHSNLQNLFKEYIKDGLKTDPYYADKFFNMCENTDGMADMEILDKEKRPVGAIFTDKPYINNLEQTLWNMSQYKKAGYNVKFLSVLDCFEMP